MPPKKTAMMLLMVIDKSWGHGCLEENPNGRE